MSLLKYTIRRFLALIPILFGVLLITFVMTRALPGSPVLSAAGELRGESQAQYIAKLEERYGFNQPVLVQFVKYLRNLFSGDWGESLSVHRGATVAYLIGKAFPRTFEITILSMTLATVVGVNVGIISAVNRNKLKDTVIRFIALSGVAIPIFWLGLLLQYIFAFNFGWLPAGRYFSASLEDLEIITGLRLLDSLLLGKLDYFWDTILHLIMPVFCLAFVFIAGITRQTRSSMLEVLELDYVRTARAKGCKERDVIRKHAFRNALIPTITVVGLSFAGLLGGAVLTETTFTLHGMGWLVVAAINGVDYDIINASVFIMTIIFVTANLVIDLMYGIVDPRIRY